MRRRCASRAAKTVQVRHSQSRACALFAASQLPLLMKWRTFRPFTQEQILVRARICSLSGGRMNCYSKFLKLLCFWGKVIAFFFLFDKIGNGRKEVLEMLKKKNRQTLLSYGALLLCPVITFYLFDLYTHNPFTSMSWQTQLLNIVFYELSGVLLFGVLRTLRLALMLQSALFMVLGLANYFVLDFRSAPIMPWDIYSINTAASVAGDFTYSLGREAVLVLLGFVLLLCMESHAKLKAPGRFRFRLLLILLPLLLLWGYTDMIQDDGFIQSFGLYDKLFTPTVMNKRDGNVVAFVMEMEYLDVEVPEGYSAQEAGEFYESWKTEEYGQALAEPESLRRPNLIVIMDEAFSDLGVLGEVPSNMDYMPFLHSLQKAAWDGEKNDLQEIAENAELGYLNVSVLGGNTANTEFEFLTGHSLQFLPQGSVAYQQYLKTPQPSLVSYLKDLGYTAQAVHPYNASGWERNRVYPLLGFDQFFSQKNFTTRDSVIRGYLSDEACFDKIRSLYERKKKGTPLFVFAVTMQNHGGYTESYDNFTPDVTVENNTSSVLSRYLSLIKRTDSALQELVEYFAEEEEDTVIVFFGDHQPATNVSNPILRFNGTDPNSLTEEENLLRYKVPYLIWSNFDREENLSREGTSSRGTSPQEVAASQEASVSWEGTLPREGTLLQDGTSSREETSSVQETSPRETSAGYLAIDVLEACGLPLPPYQAYLETLRQEYPVVSGMRIMDKEGRTVLDSQMSEEEQDACREDLLPYQTLQYYMLFDYPQEESCSQEE